MKKIILLIFLIFIIPSLAFGQNCDSSIDGYSRCKMSVIDFQGMPEPSTSQSSNGRMYFDDTDNKFKCSEDGAAFANCVGGGGGGGGGSTVTIEIDDASVTSGTLTINFLQGNGLLASESPTDQVNVSMDDVFVLTTGDTITGTLTTTNLTVTNTMTGTLTGNADTATNLAANPADCAANEFADAIAASGDLTCNPIVDADVPDTITIDLAATATALAANGGNCGAGNYPLGVDASGAVESCTADDDTPDDDSEVPDTLTVDNSSTVDPDAVSCDVGDDDLISEDCIGDVLDASEIEDIFVFNTGDTFSGTLFGGTFDGVNVTSGADPGHTHTGASISSVDISDDTNLTCGTNCTLTGDEISVDDSFLLNTGDVGTGVYDFGGATSLEIPNGTSPTVDATGEIALDTTGTQLVVYDNVNVIAFSPREQRSFIIENLAAADDDFEFFMADEAITIKSVGCHCRGTCSTPAQISLEDRAGNAMTHTTPTCSTGSSNATYQDVVGANSLVAGEGMRFDVDNAVSPETDEYTIGFTYIVNRQ